MKNFNEIEYKRLNFDDIKEQVTSLTKRLDEATEYETFIYIFKQIVQVQNHIEEMYDYADIRNMRDSSDEFYNDEINFWNEYKPKFDLLFNSFYEICMSSNFKEQLKEVVPENFFNIIEFQLRINKEEIMDLKKRENELKLEYRKIVRQKVIFGGEEKTIGYVSSFFSNKDRNIRKEAHDTVNDFYYRSQSELDTIYFQLINTRNEMATILGFDDYSIYSLYKLKRFGYNYDDIEIFRNNVIKYIIPLCKKMNEWKKEELNLEDIEYYDTIYFKEMPKLLYNGSIFIEKFKDSLKNIDDNLSYLYEEMVERGYIDLEARDNKVNFSITNYLVESSLPTITANLRNSYLDVQVISHEFGHAYQKYNAGIKDKNYIVSALLKYPTFDIAEIFSFAMELICLPHITNLFEEQDYKKYCFMKIYNLASILPYICLVDEFQQKIYAFKNLKVEDIRRTWLELTKKYSLEKNNAGHINLETGGYFYRQSHIIEDPFYYIDYALSYFGAFALADSCKNDLKLFEEIGAVASYYPFDKLIKDYNMPNPFDEGSVSNIAKMLEKNMLKYK